MSRSSLTSGALLALALCLLLAPAAAAGEAGAKAADEPRAAADAPDAAAGETGDGAPALSARVLYLDPQTGEVFRKRPSKRRTMEVPVERLAGLRWSHEGVRFLTRPDGTQVAWHPGGFRSALVASIGPDGRLTTTHVSGEDSEVPPADPPTAADEDGPAEAAREVGHE